jgi:hypothetical protein
MRKAALPLIAAVLIAGCGSSGREAIGLRVPPPDEFLVVSRKPFAVPADLTALPPPSPGAPSRVDPDPVAQAQAALAGRPVEAAGAAPSAGEASLLAASGAAAADPDIRRTLVAEAPAPERRFGLDSLFGFPIDQTGGAESGERVDATAEAARLRAQGVAAPVAPAPPPPAE